MTQSRPTFSHVPTPKEDVSLLDTVPKQWRGRAEYLANAHEEVGSAVWCRSTYADHGEEKGQCHEETHGMAPRCVASPSSAGSFHTVLDKASDLPCLHNLIKWRKYLVLKIICKTQWDKRRKERTLWTRRHFPLCFLVTISHARRPQISEN